MAAVGALLLVVSQAATFSISLDPEKGVASGSASPINDPTASGGVAIQFGSQGFVHPGILVGNNQLNFTKSKIAANQVPWKTAFDHAKGNQLASKSYTPKPVTKVQCTTAGLLNDYEQIGCVDLNRDSAATYTQALMWKLTGDRAYADKAIQIMNAWSSTLKEVPLDDPNGSNPKNDAEFWQSRLTLGWSSESIIRGAELIRHSDAGWQQADITRFETMLRTIYYPHLAEGWTGGSNPDASWAEGLINMGIFLDDKQIYQKGIDHWKGVARSMIYVASDGSKPQQFLSPRDNKYKTLTYGNPTSFIDGLEVETCRDLSHTFMGLGALANGAETAYIQGLDLYSDPEFKNKIMAGFELNSNYVNQALDYMAANGINDSSLFDDTSSGSIRNVTIANWKLAGFPCADFKLSGGSAYLGQEIALNHYMNRLNLSLPNTKILVERKRPQSGGNHLFFEALTHANNPNR